MELMDRYGTLKQKVTDRKDPFDRFINLLENETTWLTSPASTRFHLSEEQGLLKHSVGVSHFPVHITNPAFLSQISLDKQKQPPMLRPNKRNYLSNNRYGKAGLKVTGQQEASS